MAEPIPVMQWSQVDGLAVVEILSHDVTGPAAAKDMGEQLLALWRSGQKRLVLNLSRVRVMSSTGFATILQVWKQVEGGLCLCGLTPSVRLGADILSLSQYIHVYETEAEAVASFSAPETLS